MNLEQNCDFNNNTINYNSGEQISFSYWFVSESSIVEDSLEQIWDEESQIWFIFM